MIAFWLLCRLVGERAFLDMYRDFHLEYRQTGATLEDFIRFVKKVSKQDLGQFFDEWVYGTKSSGHLLGKMPLEQILRLYQVEPGAPGEADEVRR